MSGQTDQPCRVCSAPAAFIFRKRLLRYDVDYFQCPACGYVQTEAPYWLKEAYGQAINDSDTGIMVRNQQNVGVVVMTLLALQKLRGTVVDHAGGYGILVRLLRDAGIDARWRDKYCENVMARGFDAEGSRTDVATAFEVFEHLVDPVSELRAILAVAPTVVLSTELIRSAAAPSPVWWYLSPHHGQHIGFFRVSTLEAMASKLGCHYRSDGRSIHIFSIKPIPFMWRPLLKVARAWRVVARLTLRSKTVSDSEILQTRNSPTQSLQEDARHRA